MDMPTGRKRVLVFCRNYLVEIFRKGAEPLADKFDFRFLTDGVCSGTRDTRRAFYAALALGARSAEITPEDEDDVVARCRLLRNIDRAQASKLVHAMAVTLGDEIDRTRPDVVLSQMVDEYVTHILGLLAQKRGLGYVAYCWSYFPGRAFVLADPYGRPFRWRQASDEEVAEDLARISDVRYRRNYNQSDQYRWSKHLFRMAREHVKTVVHLVRGKIERDPWNLHYRVMPYCAAQRRFRDFPRRALFDADWSAKLSALKARRPNAPVVYLPLAYVPESTTDYWITDRRAADYDRIVPRMIRELARGCIVVVKEHAHMMGKRDGRLLEEIASMPDVVSVHPTESSNAVADAADAIVLGAGSAGVEAAVRGKPVFSFCGTSYWFDVSGATLLELDRMEGWSEAISASLAGWTPMEAPAQHEFLRTCLASTVRSRTESGVWPQIDEDDLAAVLSIAVARAHPVAAR